MAVHEARSAGFDRINADLMFGLPGQTPERWERDLREVLAWPIDHLSAYELTIEPDTAFGRTPPALPVEDDAVRMWTIALTETGRAGFPRYEVSNYAKPGHESRHNLKYWRDETVIGFGASAWGHRDGVRTANARNLAAYLAAADRGFPPATIDELPRHRRPAETLVLNLRMKAGCDVQTFDDRYGEGALARFHPVLAPHLAAGRLERFHGTLRLTDAGLLVANAIWAGIYAASRKAKG
jgi:oxygen-independent coproporphyrinogen-3 oxidase